MKPEVYQTIYDRACERKGGEQPLEMLLIAVSENAELARLGTDRYLAEFTRKVFQSGFVWRVVDQKWPAFEEMFWGFDVEKLLMMPDEMLERKASDPKIIRHLKKVWSIRENAMMISDLQQKTGSFSELIAHWPSSDIIGLWQLLKKKGSRLGGNTGPYALRALGKDTFLLSRDVEGYLRTWKVIEGGVNTQKSLKQAQAFFNQLHEDSGRSYAELSRLVSLSTGKNIIQTETDYSH